MKVKELIEELKNCPPEADVVVYSEKGGEVIGVENQHPKEVVLFTL